MGGELDFTVIMCRGKQLELTDDLRQFPEVVLDARDSELITDIARGPQAELGVAWEWLYHHFVTQPDTDGRRYQAPFLTAYVDEDGSVFSLSGMTFSNSSSGSGRLVLGPPSWCRLQRDSCRS